MSYLIVVIIGGAAGWIAGQYVKGSEAGIVPDLIAGAAGACLAVLFTRVIGFAPATGFIMSTLIAISGAVVALLSMRYVLKEEPVKVKRRPRR
ncbi:MAG TPA: GlsB/YeaQ/YmgE family stress response membrane protein [Thermoanaerobaculia bacterium]|nr:GlsB/YeaQ/YmgE family stress response membrane protein [Thermoanaerobaculia bacterium]